MMRKFIIFFVCLISVSLLLAACSMPASTSPKVTATGNATAPFPVVTSAQMVHDIVSGTQTAMALSGQIQPTSASTQGPTATQSYQFPGVATATPGGLVTVPATTSAAAVPTHLAFPTSTPGKPATYTVQKGEFCYCLARRFNVNPQDLINANSACKSNPLDPGTVLNIPQSGTWPSGAARALKAHPTNYTVGSGETIYSIACSVFGDVDPNLIIAANGLTSPYTLTYGKVIYIP
jgi:LysM repeat protein